MVTQLATNNAGTILSPLLVGMNLTADDMEALAHQGFVSAERRGRGYVFKLRFRRGGRQQVRYLGTNASHADAVRAALLSHQWACRFKRRITARAREIGALGRSLKLRVAALVAKAGWYFHGHQIRRRRTNL